MACSQFAVSVVAATILQCSGAWAACAPFIVLSPEEGREVHFSDLDNSGGPSVGDKRFLRRAANDVDGNQIGELYAISTIFETNDAGDASKQAHEGIFILSDGAVFLIQTDTAHRTGVTATTERLSPPASFETQITGGTGAYAGAHGTILVEQDGLATKYQLDLACE